MAAASVFRACSISMIASEYASSPVAHAGTQTRTVSPGPCLRTAADARLERVEGVRVAEEIRDRDEQVLQQRAGFARMRAQERR